MNKDFIPSTICLQAYVLYYTELGVQNAFLKPIFLHSGYWRIKKEVEKQRCPSAIKAECEVDLFPCFGATFGAAIKHTGQKRMGQHCVGFEYMNLLCTEFDHHSILPILSALTSTEFLRS